jgi:hypothetical protein
LGGDKLGIDPEKVESFKNAAATAAKLTPGTALLANGADLARHHRRRA